MCGTQGRLSFEHLPPRSMGNASRAEMLDMFQALALLDGRDPGRGQIMQRGSGSYSLCKRCNERSGHLYVRELKRWSDVGMGVLADLNLAAFDSQLEPNYVHLELAEVHPGAVLKQIVTMMLAISPPGFAFAPQTVELRDFAQDPDWTGLPDRFRFYLTLFNGPYVRLNGGSATLTLGPDGGGATFLMELASPPFAYVMTVDEAKPPVEAGNISNFGELRADQRAATAEMDLLIGFGHTPFPADFRTKAAVDRCRADSLRSSAARRPIWLPDRIREEFGPEDGARRRQSGSG